VPLVTCPSCRTEQIAPRELVGLLWNCPGCGHEFRIGADRRRGRPGRPSKSLLLIAICAGAIALATCGCAGLFMMSGMAKSFSRPGKHLTASELGLWLRGHGYVDDITPDPRGPVYLQISRDGTKCTLLAEKHLTEADAVLFSESFDGGFAWGRFSFIPYAGDIKAASEIRSLLR
jgi:hypothetical protein